jgi:hypothetical protein
MSNSESDPLLDNASNVTDHFSCNIPKPCFKLPTSFQLFDISEDNKFLALIDNKFKLQVYELNGFGDQTTIKQQTTMDISCGYEIRYTNSVFVYISVASETGHVAVSFLNMNIIGDAFKKDFRFDNFAKSKVYRRHGNEEDQEQYLDRMYGTCRIY